MRTQLIIKLKAVVPANNSFLNNFYAYKCCYLYDDLSEKSNETSEGDSKNQGVKREVGALKT